MESYLNLLSQSNNTIHPWLLPETKPFFIVNPFSSDQLALTNSILQWLSQATNMILLYSLQLQNLLYNLQLLNYNTLQNNLLTQFLQQSLTETLNSQYNLSNISNLTTNRKEYLDINPNCRDLGGLGKIGFGKMFRGGLYGGDLKKIKNLGITHEITLTPNKRHLPVDVSNIYGGNWWKMSDALKGAVLSKCMLWVTEGKKVYIHCDRGCDRTGIFCALLEGMLGVSADEIKKDLLISHSKGGGFTMRHPELTVDGYIKTYGKGSGTMLENFINNVSLKYGVNKNLIYNFINAVNNNPSIISAKFGGKLFKHLFK